MIGGIIGMPEDVIILGFCILAVVMIVLFEKITDRKRKNKVAKLKHLDKKKLFIFNGKVYLEIMSVKELRGNTGNTKGDK